MENIPANKRFHRLCNPMLKSYVWLYFMIFAMAILLLLWVFQYFFLESYYRSMKANNMETAASELKSAINSGDLARTARGIAFKNNLFILITDASLREVFSENTMGSFSYFESDRSDNHNMFAYSMKQDLNSSGQNYITRVHENKMFQTKEMFYVTKVQATDGTERYIFLESSIEPIDSTAQIIKKQLIYITVILLELAFIISLFISRRIAKPITAITASAKKFAEGDFQVQFNGTGYLEVAELSEVLNKARGEVSKVTDLRKDLIANISHDLRTPLTMVKAYAEMIRDLSGDNPVKRKEHIQVIIDESDRLSNLVSSILELSRLESGNLELELEDFDVHEKLHEVMNRYTILMERDGYNIQLELDEDKTCRADTAKIDQVLYNLINNAVNYCGEDKQIIVRQRNQNGKVRIEISDHGKGIPQEQLPVIFDRYYRGDKYKRETVGTGLGLSIVKEILKRHSFSFGVQSTEGKGSTFWFEMNEI